MKTKYHDPLAGIVCSANRNTWRIAAVLMLSLGSAMPGAASELLPERTAPNTIGYVDQPAASVLATSANVFSGWALSRSGVARVELVVDGRQRLPARLGIAREEEARRSTPSTRPI